METEQSPQRAAEPTLGKPTPPETTKDALDYANGILEEAGQDENKFQKAIAAWRTINLSQLVPKLDTTASDLAAHQRDALVERKDLAQKTKDFRKLEDTAKLSEVKGLLKVSTAFFSVYSPLSEAPDPYPLLEASVESLVTADETLPRLEEENKQLQARNAKLSKQLEDAEKHLQEEREARKVIEETQDTRIKEVEASWSAVLTEKQDNWDSRERSLEEKAENYERVLKELKANYEVSQRMGREDDSARGIASSAELELLTADLDRANTRLADVEARNEQLRVDLAQAATSKSTYSNSQSVEDDPAFLRLQSENSLLLRKADTLRLENDSEKRELQSTLRVLRKEAGLLKSDNAILQRKLNDWNDHDEIKKELEILKSIEFATGDLEDNDLNSRAGEDEDVSADTKNLEQLLLARNKKLNNELTVLRVSHQDLTARLETLQEDLSTTNMELERSRNLNATLENDLSRVQNEVADTQPAMSVAGTYTSRYPASSSRRTRKASPTSSIISGFDGPGTLESLRNAEGTVAPGILPMITAQRDRFKKRITDLESELSKSIQTVSTLRQEIASLQSDNVSLYEKSRYTSSYRATNYAPSSMQTSSAGDGSGSPMDKYKSAYETRISPFAAFRGRESTRALKRMSLPERMLFQLTRMVLSTRASRNLFACYLMGLHVLLFYTLFSAAAIDVDNHITHLADNAAPITGAAEHAGAEGWHQQEGFSEHSQR